MNKEEQLGELAMWLQNGGCPSPHSMALALYDVGYRKLPERPKVLSIAQCLDAMQEAPANMPFEECLQQAAQAQLEADIKHYEGGEM
jgi:hypothetical protein